MQRRHRVRVARHLEGQHRHAQRLLAVLGAYAPEAQKILLRQPQRPAQRIEVTVRQLRGEPVVARIHGRVGGENGALRHVLGGAGEVRPRRFHAQPRVLQRGEGAVPLVQVQAAPVDARGVQRADAAHAQQQLLADADALIAEVQPRRQLAVLVAVPVHVGVEQQELVASHPDLPDLGQQGLGRRDRDLHHDGFAGRGEGGGGGERLGGRAYPLGVLVALPVDPLAKIRLAVEQADRHQRQSQVRGGLQVIAGQDPQAAAVDGQRLVNAELRREISHGANAQGGGVDGGPGPRFIQVEHQLAVGGVDPRPQRRVLRQPFNLLGGELPQHQDGIVIGRSKTVRIHVAKQLDDVRVPGPPQVAGQRCEVGFEFLGSAHGPS